ncbi:MAG: DCL family protein [Verrucomicrobia bacterium]|nr:DCL family protein [Verrucomicrobiota bacterium]
MSQIRQSYQDGETITDPAHVEAIGDLLLHHKERNEKVGTGVKRFFVDFAPDHPTRCFWIERVDGTKTKFGVPACLVSVRNLNLQSLRQAVESYVEEFKVRRIGTANFFISDYSGVEFAVTEAHVDHEVPFELIAENFFQDAGLSLDDGLLTKSSDSTSKPTWIDQPLIKRFVAYHAEFPLRMVSARENLSDIRRDHAETSRLSVSVGAVTGFSVE